MNKISNGTPAPALVDAYIKEIAKAYGVPWAGADELGVPELNGEASKVRGRPFKQSFLKHQFNSF
jgi:vacuolar protein sorting-associated protein IST1